MVLSACDSNEHSESKVDCQKSPNDSRCIEEQKVQVQEKEKFKSLGDCLKAKKAEAGVDPNSKPTVQMLQQCINQ